MAKTTILHIGEDICQRIPVMETAGLTVLQSEMAIPEIRRVFDDRDTFSAVIFHSDICAPPQPTVCETRNLCDAPFVLFQNPAVQCDEAEFNLVIPPLTPPAIWLQKLVEIIDASHELREQSMQLRQDCVTARTKSETLRTASARNRVCPIDPDALWNGETGAIPDSKPPEESHSDGARAKAS